MSVSELAASLAEANRKHLDPAAPGPARMMAAKGLLPLPPREMVIVLLGLSQDAQEGVATAARVSLGKLPDNMFKGALDQGLPAAALRLLVPVVQAKEPLLEQVALLRDTPDEALAMVAKAVPEKIAELLAQNQERLLRSESLVRGLSQNPQLIRSSIDRIFDFLVRSGVIYADMPEFGDALARLSPQEMEEAAQKVELPPEISAFLEDTEESDQRAAAVTEVLESASQEIVEGAKERVPLLKLLTTLGASQKVALAIKGNKEARAILLRDSNRVVASAAIRNPRITEQEVATAAISKQISDEVIRIISNSKELSRAYSVKLALVNNPKTPLPTAMRFLTLLRGNDVKAVAKSKNISSALANQAKRMVANKD